MRCLGCRPVVDLRGCVDAGLCQDLSPDVQDSLLGEEPRGRPVRPFVTDASDVQELRWLLDRREQALNRQLGVTMFCAGVAYGLCLLCSLTGVFLTGRFLGVIGFLPGMLCLFAGSALAFRHRHDAVSPTWLKYGLLSLMLAAILDVSLIQLVWAVPCLVGFAAMVYAYHNVRLTVVYNTVILSAVFLAAAANAMWGMPNPDMLPYPETIAGVKDGYVTLWAMEHPEDWSRLGYFLRVLRFHTLPLIFLLLIVTGAGYAMSRRTNQRVAASLARLRRIREIETCLLLMAGGSQSHELIAAVLGTMPSEAASVPPLSKAFVDALPAAQIPSLMKTFRRRCATDPVFAEHAAANPEAALKEVLTDIMV